MKALVCDAFGPPDTLSVRELPTPEPGRGQVRVDVHAAGCNFPDLLIIQGLYQFKPPFPFSPGGEVAGVISAVGEGVEGLKVGDRVMASMIWGGYAETVIAEAAMTIPLPDPFDFQKAAGLVLTYATSYYALTDRANLKADETVLVLGASGGVGLATIQLAKATGAKVIAAASSPEKLALCTQAGADAVIDYRAEDLKARTKALTEGRGVDVVYDPVGGDYAEPALRSMAWEGRYLVIGFASGSIPKIPLNLALLKGCSVVGVFWGAFIAREPARHRAQVDALLSLWADGKIEPVVSEVFRLEDAPKALTAFADRTARGKMVVALR